MADESPLLIYGAPLVGVLLLSVGIAGGVMGGYSVVQSDLGLCGDPSITVASEETTAQYTGPDAPPIQRLSVAELSPAEREAFRQARSAPMREAEIRGEAPHLDAFRAGVLVSYEGGERYVTLASLNRCVGASPLLLPLGVVFILVGVAGILTPPLYRRIEAFESR